MKITDLKRSNLRYILFRFKNEDITRTERGKTVRIQPEEFKSLLEGWGHTPTKTKAKKLLFEIRNHFEEQLYFTGWANFASEITNKKTNVTRGTNKSWDVGMTDGDGSIESQLANIARMVNRPNKWFLFGIYYTEAVSTRGLNTSTTVGLNYFEKQELASSGGPVLRERSLYPDASGNNREFDYLAIYKKGLKNGTYH